MDRIGKRFWVANRSPRRGDYSAVTGGAVNFEANTPLSTEGSTNVRVSNEELVFG